MAKLNSTIEYCFSLFTIFSQNNLHQAYNKGFFDILKMLNNKKLNV